LSNSSSSPLSLSEEEDEEEEEGDERVDVKFISLLLLMNKFCGE